MLFDDSYPALKRSRYCHSVRFADGSQNTFGAKPLDAAYIFHSRVLIAKILRLSRFTQIQSRGFTSSFPVNIADRTRLGRYEIRSKIGAGGRGEVYLAQDTKLDRKVALKILPVELANNRSNLTYLILIRNFQ